MKILTNLFEMYIVFKVVIVVYTIIIQDLKAFLQFFCWISFIEIFYLMFYGTTKAFGFFYNRHRFRWVYIISKITNNKVFPFRINQIMDTCSRNFSYKINEDIFIYFVFVHS